MDEWLKESTAHGWPSFRDNELVGDFVRILPNGETVSTTGTHLGHNLPDDKGNRFVLYAPRPDRRQFQTPTSATPGKKWASGP